ncbi:2'-5' RNA ligase family protein [Nocardioides perillae]|uniref:2'-5' RNA ligase n=1 Tax=Nocardioides perillae TaxID=1119534 RepID=A0A7Y9RUU7_9ACTN|nr:2'-5' RNA ligase [Nocardioides perillae]
MPLHAVELLADEAGDHVVRRDWASLHDAGLPSQLDHTGATNAPHVTLLAAPALPPDEEVVRLLAPLLPLEVRPAGLLVLGGRRVTVARALDVPDPLVAAVAELRRGLAELPHQGWLPHVTLARRVDRAQVQAVVDVLGWEDVPLRLTTLRRWDPEAGEVTVLARG